MSDSAVFVTQLLGLQVVQAGLLECAHSSGPPVGQTADGPVVGLFRVRRELDVSPQVQKIAESVLDGDKDIRIGGIRIVIPVSRQYVFATPLPVFVAAVGTEFNVSISKLELIRDEQTSQPAILVTTASSIKPDLVVVLAVLPENKPDTEPSGFDISLITTKLLQTNRVPAQHTAAIIKATQHAWRTGMATQTASRMLPKTGKKASQHQLEAAAREIVKQLVDQQVVTMGLFFWMRLGYWLLTIIMLLLEQPDSD